MFLNLYSLNSSLIIQINSYWFDFLPFLDSLGSKSALSFPSAHSLINLAISSFFITNFLLCSFCRFPTNFFLFPCDKIYLLETNLIFHFFVDQIHIIKWLLNFSCLIYEGESKIKNNSIHYDSFVYETKIHLTLDPVNFYLSHK